MKRTKNILWGVILVAVGVLFALRALDIMDFSIFFDGWWTLFIIVPCAVGLFTERDKTGNLIGVIIGAALFLACQDFIGFDILWKLLVPAIIVIIGLKLIFGSSFDAKVREAISKFEVNGNGTRSVCATFSGANMNADGEVFEGAELNAVFGGVKCDLRGAIIEKDCVIKASAIFGGIDILVSDKVNVIVNSTSIFGGVDNKTPVRHDVPNLYITGTCMFGGVDIK